MNLCDIFVSQRTGEKNTQDHRGYKNPVRKMSINKTILNKPSNPFYHFAFYHFTI